MAVQDLFKTSHLKTKCETGNKLAQKLDESYRENEPVHFFKTCGAQIIVKILHVCEDFVSIYLF